ncbi:hypothetical protein O6H91_09G122000 [Diphasiastrum complanatum]|uniref:Uncharacterized protein n=1 Tax=Diphasiastrum complanatum TaxID=34168 RepID=A0ACC2CTZ2_DIPCM|nr:hypothetical protein O6H91_09G122000 [Diphasiastrum complanatum]
MATSLGAQLRQLAIAQGRDGDTPADLRTKPSLIFTPSEAADIDLLTIYGMARAGLEELSEMDARFEPFKKTLFNQESTQIDRELQTKDFNDKLNISLSNYLHLLSGYLLLPPAHQTLEYLIRRYKIHVYNVEDLCMSMIPYHETSIFVRILQILHLKKTCWAFLDGVKNSGAAPPRAVLVQQCIQDVALLEAICGAASIGSNASSKSRAMTSFAVVILMETLAAVPSISKEIVTRMLPFILQSFDKGVSEDHRVGALMVVGALVGKTTLSVSLIDTIFNSMAKSFQQDVNELDGVSRIRLPLMVMVLITQTQKLENFPLKAFKFLVKVRELPSLLTELSKNFNTKNFLSLFLDTLTEHSVIHQHYEQVFANIIRIVPMESHVELILSRLMRLALRKEAEELDWTKAIKIGNESKDVIKRLLLLVKNHFPDQLGNAVNALLKDVGKSRIINDEAIAYLREVFSQSLLMPVAESRTTLLLAIDHVEPWIREKALRQLSEFVQIPSANQNTEGGVLLLRDIFLRRLYDDDINVVRAVLNVQGLVKLFMPEPIFQALVYIISRCAKVDETGDKSTKQNAKVVAKLAFEVLSSHFLDVYPNYLEQVTSIVLGHLLVSAKNWRFNLFVMKQAIKLPVTLFTSFSKIEDDSLQRKGMMLSKDGKQTWLSNVNTKIILALSTHFLENASNCFSVFRKAISGSKEAKSLSLLVVSQILKRRLGVDMKFVQECLQFLREEWETSEAEADHLVSKLQKVDYNVEFPTPDLYDRLESGHTHVHMEILLHNFLNLLTHIKGEQDAVSHEVLSELFVLFASSTHRHLFKPHIKVLLRCLSSTWIVFLTQFFTEGLGVPAAVQVYSLDVYASQFLSIANSYAFGSAVEDEIQTSNLDMQLESCLPSLLVALGSPLKAVRRSAAECLSQLHGLWMVHKISAAKNGTKQISASMLSSDVFQEFLEAIADCKDDFVSDGNYLESFFTMSFCPSGESNSEQKFTSKSSKAIMLYLLHHIFLLPPHAQRVLLLALRGTGYTHEKYLATHELLHQLLRKRQEHIRQHASTDNTQISQMEVLLLEVLLKVNLSHVSMMLKRGRSASREAQSHYLSAFFDAIDVEGGPIADPAVVQPCLLSLKFLTSDLFSVLHTSIQDDIFQVLIHLSMNKDEVVRLAAQEVLKQLDIPSTAIARHISFIYVKDAELESGKKKKRNTGKGASEDRILNTARRWPLYGKELNSVTALLEFLLSKPNISDREKLWGPLFDLLNSIVEKEWLKELMSSSEEYHLTVMDEETQVSSTKSSKGTYVLHVLLIILERLANSALEEPSAVKEEISKEFDVDAVVACIEMATDGVTRNHALALLTVAGKLYPERVLNRMLDVLSVVGISTLGQDDSHSQRVMQEMFAAVIPSWLSSNQDPGELLQTFSLSLPKVSVHRRMPLAVNVIRVLGEETGLHLLIYHLLQQYLEGSDSPRDLENGASLTHSDNRLLDSRDWRIAFLQQLCRHYPPHIRVQALVKLLNLLQLKLKVLEGTKVTSKTGKTKLWVLQQLVANFIGAEIQNQEQHLHQNVDNDDTIQKAFIVLMEQTLSQLHLLRSYSDDSFAPSRNVRKDSQTAAYFLLDSITKIMSLPSFCRAIAMLLKHKDSKIRRKVLQLYISKMKERDGLVSTSKEKARPLHGGASFGDADSCVQIIDQIVDVLTHTMDDLSLSIKQAAVLALDLSAKLFAGTMPLTFISCLPVLTANLKSQSKSLVAACLRCAASILSELGPQGLPVLPEFMADLLQFAPKAFALSKAEPNKGTGEMSYERSEVPSALLVALRVILEKLGSFLSPYLEEIIRLVVLQPHVLGSSDVNLGSYIQDIQHLLPEKIPARLLLDPLISNYDIAIESGPESTCVIFQMLAHMASKLDRASVVSYNGKIFEFCLTVFDIRRKRPKTITSVSLVEKDAIAAFVALVMKLSETTFKPLFVTMIEWAETQIFYGEPIGRNVYRNIVFYKLVNQLEEKLRSVFVPYFQYLIDSCVSYLTSSHTESGLASSSKKKRKLENARDLERLDKQTDVDLSMWHLRALVISALHKCFLFDSIGFLDASKFQLLLEPIVSQMVLEGPSDSLLAESPDIPTVSEVDDLLVMCLGQMALTAGTDALWKPLNHEVLMCTRNENIRARRLGLEVVKFMVERLKEEYLVLLPETIPFLAELLEDEDLSIIAKTQEVIKILEELSGESISQYL